MIPTAAILILGCVAAVGQVDHLGEQRLPHAIPPALDDRHHFGMEWDGEAKGAMRQLLPRLERCIDRWLELPDRLARLVWWGGAAASATWILGGQLALLVLWLLWRHGQRRD